MQLSSTERLPDIEVKARKRILITAVVIVRIFFHFQAPPVELIIKLCDYFIMMQQSYDYMREKDTVFCMYNSFFYYVCFDIYIYIYGIYICLR